MFHITVNPGNHTLTATAGEILLDVLRENGFWVDAPCAGNGQCGKCTAIADGKTVRTCKTAIDKDMTVTLPEQAPPRILRDGPVASMRMRPIAQGYPAAFDIGSTTLVCYLLDPETGEEIASESMLNPQTTYGADVISRIQSALQGTMAQQTTAIRSAMETLIQRVCSDANITPEKIGVVSVVGNPAMQQIFLGIPPENLVRIPFAPVLTKAEAVPCETYFPACPEAVLLIIPDIAGYVGADTVGCVLSCGIHTSEDISLLIDIGTNAEMVLGNSQRMIACSAAAGPALEGANISCGMRAAEGAINHVWLESGALRWSTIGSGKPVGICGSGLIDAVAAAVEAGMVNGRGRIQNPDRIIHLTEKISLTQEDIRQVQLAKGAIAAGIDLMLREMGIGPEDVARVYLAGAFGNYLDPASACKIGLLTDILAKRVLPAGNAAGSGAKLIAANGDLLPACQLLTERIETLELSQHPLFRRTFARAMNFPEVTPWNS